MPWREVTDARGLGAVKLLRGRGTARQHRCLRLSVAGAHTTGARSERLPNRGACDCLTSLVVGSGFAEVAGRSSQPQAGTNVARVDGCWDVGIGEPLPLMHAMVDGLVATAGTTSTMQDTVITVGSRGVVLVLPLL